MLVLTGLAGTVKPSATTVRERKTVVTGLKESRDHLFNQVAGLSLAQLTYKPHIQQPSIAELLYIQLELEQNTWQAFKSTMSANSNPCDKYRPDAIPENAATTIANNKVAKAIYIPRFTTPHATLLINRFNNIRKDVIKYARTSTEDLKNNYVATGDGDISAFHCFLLLSRQTDIIAAHIAAIKELPSFPKA